MPAPLTSLKAKSQQQPQLTLHQSRRKKFDTSPSSAYIELHSSAERWLQKKKKTDERGAVVVDVMFIKLNVWNIYV